jgi:Kdo2-lipid IVA lauroyltransferase/acyltransferase
MVGCATAQTRHRRRQEKSRFTQRSRPPHQLLWRLEHNGFNGHLKELYAFWAKHWWEVRRHVSHAPCITWADSLQKLPVSEESAENPPKHWKWRLEWLAQITVEKIAALLPGPVVFRLGEALGGLAWHFMRERRNIVLRNLRIAFYGEHDLESLREMARHSFRRTAANLFSALHTTGLSARQIDQVVTVENPELVAEAIRHGHGVVLLPCHMGNWEILTRIHRSFPEGHENGALYRPLNNPLLDARVLAQRQAESTRLFSKRDSFHTIAGFVREGGILGILADQRVGSQGELVTYFGRLTRASPLPSLVARRGKSRALGMSVSTVSPGKWTIRYHPIEGPITTAACMDAIERSLRVSPLDVFWLQERWKPYLRKSRDVREWLGADSPATGKPHRALLWLPGTPDGWKIPDGWTHPDVIYEVVPPYGGPALPRTFGNLHCHAGPDPGGRESLAAFLERVDASAALPIDFILTTGRSKDLEKAARRVTIPLISLPENS